MSFRGSLRVEVKGFDIQKKILSKIFGIILS